MSNKRIEYIISHILVCICILTVLVIYYFKGLHPEMFLQYEPWENEFLEFARIRTNLLVFGLGILIHLSYYISSDK